MLGSKVVKSPAVGAGPSAFQASTDTPVHGTFDFFVPIAVDSPKEFMCNAHHVIHFKSISTSVGKL